MINGQVRAVLVKCAKTLGSSSSSRSRKSFVLLFGLRELRLLLDQAVLMQTWLNRCERSLFFFNEMVKSVNIKEASNLSNF